MPYTHRLGGRMKRFGLANARILRRGRVCAIQQILNCGSCRLVGVEGKQDRPAVGSGPKKGL